MDNTNTNFSLPVDFKWGVSTSSYQIEGGNFNSDWYSWEKYKGYIEAGDACRSYEKYKEDIEILKRLKVNSYRFSIEWSRIEPEEGKWDLEVLNHYKDLIKSLKDNNIEPFVTLFHESLPIWVSKIGGFENKKIIKIFQRYTDFVVENLGSEVTFWITINEPFIYALMGYLSGEYPPGKRSIIKYLKVEHNLQIAHIRAYIGIKDIYKKFNWGRSRVSVAKNNVDYLPLDWISKFYIMLKRYFTNYSYLDKTRKYMDFIGLNYYFHEEDKFKLSIHNFLFKSIPNDKLEKQDVLGWDIYPQGIYNIMKQTYKRYNKDIFILENGISDTSDLNRIKYIEDHLVYIKKAIEEGIPVKGYFYWSLIDNYEWKYGFDAKFGFSYMDNNGNRIMKESGKKFADIVQSI